MRYKVIFDTNSIHSNESLHTFFGYRDELEKFAEYAELLIPDIVIDEISNQKAKTYKDKLNSFVSHPFFKIMNIKKNKRLDVTPQEYVKELLENETIPFVKITLTNKKDEILEHMRILSMSNTPPFEECTDKGFKDAYIFFTIQEYLEKITESIFVVTKDGKLKDSLEKVPRITVVSNFEEFEKYISEYLLDDYVLGRLQDEVNASIKRSDIYDSEINRNGNWLIYALVDNQNYRIEIDYESREIVGYTDDDIKEYISGLVNSGGFRITHYFIAKLVNKIHYLSEEESKEILQAGITNEQIFYIAEDSDVKQFYTSVYFDKEYLLNDEDKAKFNSYYRSEI